MNWIVGSNWIVAFLVIMFGVVLLYASTKTESDVLKRAAQVCTILAFVLALIIFVRPQTPKPIVSTPIPNLFIVSEGDTEGTYLIGGDKVAEYAVRDNLVVYDEIIPDTEVPIALLRVIAENPTTICAQVILAHPEREIRPQFRVDDHVHQLDKSELVPANESSVGYFLKDERIRLRPGVELEKGTILQALEPQLIDEKIVDYLPFEPTIEMRVTNIGSEGVVAQVELITGKWPEPGTIISLISDEKAGEWAVVISVDKSLAGEGALYEVEVAKDQGYVAVIYRKGDWYFTIIGPFPNEVEAEKAKLIVRSKFPGGSYRETAYVINLNSWCPQHEPTDDGYYECQSQ